MAEESGVLLTQDAAVATITLARPGLSTHTKIELVEAIAKVAADPSVRAVLLTGAGKAFCVGQDLGEHAAALRADPSHAFDTVGEHYNPIIRGLTEMPKPVIAAINGTCVGAGLGLALACDLRIAVTTARFGTAFAAIGLTCDSGMSATLVRAVGAARASELILRGDLFTAPEALAWGIVGAVAEPAEFPAAATALATRMAAGPTLAYAEIKRALATAWTLPFPEALAAEGAAQARLGLTQDHRDAVEAFLTKQSPTFHAH